MRFEVRVRAQTLRDARRLRRRLAESGGVFTEPRVTWQSAGQFPVRKPVPYGPGMPLVATLPLGILTIKVDGSIVTQGTGVTGLTIKVDNVPVITGGDAAVTIKVDDTVVV